MKIQYFSETDTLAIELTSNPANSTEVITLMMELVAQAEVTEGVS